MQANSDPWDSVYKFWFGSHSDPETISAEMNKLWFSKNVDTDSNIAQQFGSLIDQALNGELLEWHDHPRGKLAKLVLLDQFTRNVFRDTPKAFAGDAIARALTLEMISKEEDQALAPKERPFCYLPLEHSEDLKHQDQSIALFASLREAVSAQNRNAYQGYYDYAVRHRDVIVRFGRFPHRNTILGRTSTPEELAFLKQPGSSF